jgi:hypothetical protein
MTEMHAILDARSPHALVPAEGRDPSLLCGYCGSRNCCVTLTAPPSILPPTVQIQGKGRRERARSLWNRRPMISERG